MKFVIRDDDLNYFSKPDDIERWYADIFAQGIPVGFATIPFVKGVSDVYTADAPKDDIEHPISNNRELIEYVKGNPHIEILQHGVNHDRIDGIFEYARKVPLEKTRRGKEELERAFGAKVRVFVPPHDWIHKSGIRSVEAAGLDIIRGRGTGAKNILPRFSYLRNIFLTKLHPTYPFVLDCGKHKEAHSFRLEDADVFEGLAYANRKHGSFVIVAHVHGLTQEKKERLSKLIEQAKECGAQFVSPNELFKSSQAPK